MKTSRIRCLAAALCTLALPAAAARPLVQCTVTPDREVLPAESPGTAVIKVLLDAPEVPRESERPPVNLALVLDRSGSMSGSKIEQAREALVQALRRLSPRDIVSVVIYDHEVETLLPAQSAQFTEAVEARVRGIDARGNTALFGAVSQGAAEIRKNLDGRYIHRVILLSDGIANVGPSSPSDLARLGAALLKEGISVSTIGLGTDYNEDLMTQLARNSDGNHYFVESDVDLPRIFAAELGDVLSVVARKVVIEVECPPDVRPIRIIGREGEIRGQRVEIGMNQLYGGQAKYALIEVAVPSTKADEVRELALARCRYENAITSRPEKSEGRAQARFSQDLDAVRESVNRKVQEEFNDNVMAAARDEALTLYNEGKREEAAQRLRQDSRRLSEVSASLGLAPSPQSEALEKDAKEFEQQQVTPQMSKGMKADSYRIQTQQKQ